MVNSIDPLHLYNQRSWSKNTFGPDFRYEGIINHIKKELDEILEDPHDLEEWIDVVILALDGAWRAGYEPEEIIQAFHRKIKKNKNRSWPDWRQYNDDRPIEHLE